MTNTDMTTDQELANIQLKKLMREVRSHTARVRAAVRDLPKLIALQGFDMDSDQQDLREALQEIIGSATHIADVLEVEL